MEKISDAGHQRVFVAHHHHIDLVAAHGCQYGVEVGAVEIEVGAIGRRTAVAGRDVEMVALSALTDFPGESRFAAPRPEQEYIHFSKGLAVLLA